MDSFYLYEKLDASRDFVDFPELPDSILHNLNPNFELREYQKRALENFIQYHLKYRRSHLQTLFHMATGSGKTLIMAGLILYLYQHGYRDFLFFVNLDNIVQKTKENFLNTNSSKYLFADKIVIDDRIIPVKAVSNFQYSDPHAINICFTTTQKLHYEMLEIRENSLTFDDFTDKKIVLISDEAHHLNAATKRKDKKEEEISRTWEYTVDKLLHANKKNILLEFTATCDISNPDIQNEYRDKIIFDYPLRDFRTDGYSKEIKTMRSDIPVIDKAMQAIVLSQYRLKVFQDHRLYIKPVVLFKAANIADSRAFMKLFLRTVRKLDGDALQRISELTENLTMKRAYRYFIDNGISMDQLAQELKEEFGEERCISVNDEREANDTQIIVNTLEDSSNPYRAVFEVKKLDEGWDVLNLFDIVRLYETRQSGFKKVSPTTISEAQLIGRGARYCPFQLSDDQEKYKRKYDHDVDSPLRICERLYYHCQNEKHYIEELTASLKESGILADHSVEQKYVLKESFRQDPIFQDGLIFVNQRVYKGKKKVRELLENYRNHELSIVLHTGSSGEDVIMAEQSSEETTSTYTSLYTLAQIAALNYGIVHKALRCYDVFCFDRLQGYLPEIPSTRDFITNYLGNLLLRITTKTKEPTPGDLLLACMKAFKTIAHAAESFEYLYEGTPSLTAKPLKDVFTDKLVHYDNPHGDGAGVSQNQVSSDLRIDLAQEDWYVYNDNYGTTEEKSFLRYFRDYAGELKKEYDAVYLIRNERQLALYSFEEGRRFEPDFVLILIKNTPVGREQYQVFIEPKGSHLLELDQWKEDFLKELEYDTVLSDDLSQCRYIISGFPFYCAEAGITEFRSYMERLLP